MSKLNEKLLEDILLFSVEQNISKTKFGELSVNDPNFVGDLRKGRSPQANTIDRVYVFMSEFPSRKVVS